MKKMTKREKKIKIETKIKINTKKDKYKERYIQSQKQR